MLQVFSAGPKGPCFLLYLLVFLCSVSWLPTCVDKNVGDEIQSYFEVPFAFSVCMDLLQFQRIRKALPVGDLK